MQFDPDPAAAKSLVTGSATAMSPSEWVKDPEIDIIWNMLDYGWLSDSDRPASPQQCHLRPNLMPWDTEFPCSQSSSLDGMGDFMQHGAAAQGGMDHFSLAVTDVNDGTWSEILSKGQDIAGVGLDAEQDWLNLVL